MTSSLKFEEASSQLESNLNPILHRVLLWNPYLQEYCAPKITDSEKYLKEKKKSANKKN